jgi:hypothetical protein
MMKATQTAKCPIDVEDLKKKIEGKMNKEVIFGTHPNGASLRIICMKNQMKTLAKTVIIFHAKYDANIPRISYADPS